MSWLGVNLWAEAIRKHLNCSKAAACCISQLPGHRKGRHKDISCETLWSPPGWQLNVLPARQRHAAAEQRAGKDSGRMVPRCPDSLTWILSC